MTDWRTIDRLVAAEPTSDGAGVSLNRSVGGMALPELDPFLLLDEFNTDNPEDYIAGFPDHPHRGFETVTYMVEGQIRHHDSAGNTGLLRSGGVQWMTAGRGIVHSEMPEQVDGRMQGFQLWVNLPAKDKMATPRYQEFEPNEVPEITRNDGARIRVIAGDHDGTKGVVTEIAVDPIYLDVILPAGASFDQPVTRGHNALIYVFEGSAVIGENGGAAEVPTRTLAVLGDGDGISVKADTDEGARFLLLAGKPICETIARYGPFVMNTREEIMAAFDDYKEGRL